MRKFVPDITFDINEKLLGLELDSGFKFSLPFSVIVVRSVPTREKEAFCVIYTSGVASVDKNLRTPELK